MDGCGRVSRLQAGILLGMLLLLPGCDNRLTTPDQADERSAVTGAGKSGRLQVIATVGMVADLVREVGGDRVQVTQLMGSGVDPHLYKVTRDDVRTLMGADLVFYAGLMLEGKMADSLVRIGRSRPVVALSEQLDPSHLVHSAGSGGHDDPHVWMDVSTWSEGVDVVARVLSEHDAQHADEYRQRATAYRQQLQSLHEYGQHSIATIPENRRVLITSHDAFHYFGRAYQLQVLGIQGLSTESEAGLARVNELVDLIVSQDVPAVFVESSVPRKSIEALLEGARSRGHVVNIGGELFSDAMGPSGTYEGTYVGMLDHNLTTVTRALGGTAPADGWQGKLTPQKGKSP